VTLEDESDHEYIQTVRGLGYRFEVQPKGEAQPKGAGDGDELSPAVKRETAEPRQ
jgi:DNA-binding winged helix-turn-helix (wHTH) protein